MSSPNKRKRDESQAFSQLRKELEKKQEAMKISERAKNQLKKKVDELSKKHQQLKEEFQATFHGLNVEKEKLTTKVEKQTKILEDLRRYEHVQAKKIYKYAKYFSENDENISMELKEMPGESNRQKRLFEEINKLTKIDSTNQTRDERKYLENPIQRSQEALKENFNFWASLDKYIERNNKNKELIPALLKETKLLADKDLEVWNQNKELQQTQTILAKVIVELSITRAKHQIEMQRIKCNHGKCHRLCYCSKVDSGEPEKEAVTVQKGVSMKEQIARLQGEAGDGCIARNMKMKLTDVQLHSKDLDGPIFETPEETREQIILCEDFTKVACRSEGRCKTLGYSSFEKGKKNSAKEVGSTRKVGQRFLDRILRKRR